MSDFISQWLMSLKTAAPGKSHNVLGYSVKLDAEGNHSREQLLAKIGNVPPSFLPTKVQFQTIANKPSAGAKGDPKDPYNAFLFTEMCGVPGVTTSRPLPQPDLQWSGNWFYGAIGGSMAMSSTIFLREFVGKLVEPIHKEYSAFADTLAKRQTWDARFSDQPSQEQRQVPRHLGGWPVACRGKSADARINGDKYTYRGPLGKRRQIIHGTGNFDIKQTLQIVTKWSNFSNQYAFDATETFNWIYSVQLVSVGSTGELTSKVTFKPDEKPVLTSTITEKGVLIRGIGSNQTEEQKRNWDRYQEILIKTIENRVPDTSDFTSKINQGLNGQSKFIFPGGGTFDMSDPVFSNAGDLLLGLVYRQGNI
ncbi:hypothetical protein ACHAQA_003821 [Verticillium albo-atrum]